MTHDKPLLLVDGTSYLHRAFNALPPLSNRAGEPTGALYGVINMLHKLLTDYQPELIAVIFDAPGKTFRHALFEHYKAHRPPPPPELINQADPLRAIVQALGLPLLQINGVEADDVIATLARQATACHRQVLISSSDKDLTQLVDDHITLLDTMKGTVLDAAGVEQKFGVVPEQMIDYLALVGDSSDNIPGIPGVGPKTAAKWLQQYGSLDAIVAHADAIPGKVREKLKANLDQLALSRELVTLRCDVALDCKPEQLQRRPPDTEALRKLYSRYEFHTRLRQLEDSPAILAPAEDPSPPSKNYQIISDQDVLEHWLQRLREAELFALDTETDSLNYMRARLVGLSFAIDAGEAVYVPLAHDYPGAPRQLDRDSVLEQLRFLLEDSQHGKLGQNLKFDLHILANHGITLRGVRHDTMLQSYVLDATATRHDMDSLAHQYLGIETIRYEDVAGKGAKQLSFNQVPLEQAGPYAAEDADITLQLHHRLWPQLTRTGSLARLYETVEIPLISVLAGMEHRGVRIDTELLHRQSLEIGERLLALEQEAHRLAEQPFNLSSPKQLQYILFDKLGLPINKKTPKGQPSTGEDVLQELALDYPLPKLIMEHRALSKLKSTYTDRLPLSINPNTGRVHTSYHQAVTSTGRLSSSDPNLQNIPIRTPQGRRIRQAFVAPPGHRIVAADYSQIELRILAHLSQDERLLTAFANHEDVHRATAAEVFAIPSEQVDSQQRRAAKAINFGLIYGMSAFGLARQLGIERSDAQDYMDRYFDRYPGVKVFMEEIRRQAARQGYVETLFGRRLHVPDIRSRNSQRRQAAERAAINAPMQGSAADIIKRAMIAVDHWLTTSDSGAYMIMQVHDELVFEVIEDAVDDILEPVREHMMKAAELRVPLEVEIGIGNNWDEAH